jgi:hypothetical protein
MRSFQAAGARAVLCNMHDLSCAIPGSNSLGTYSTLKLLLFVRKKFEMPPKHGRKPLLMDVCGV